MLRYCGGTFRVLKRVNQIVDERTGKMMKMKSSCIILEALLVFPTTIGFVPGLSTTMAGRLAPQSRQLVFATESLSLGPDQPTRRPCPACPLT